MPQHKYIQTQTVLYTRPVLYILTVICLICGSSVCMRALSPITISIVIILICYSDWEGVCLGWERMNLKKGFMKTVFTMQ